MVPAKSNVQLAILTLSALQRPQAALAQSVSPVRARSVGRSASFAIIIPQESSVKMPMRPLNS